VPVAEKSPFFAGKQKCEVGGEMRAEVLVPREGSGCASQEAGEGSGAGLG
jgi:hypothetical protein